MSLGFKEWFISKTPMNLLLMLGLLIWANPINSKKQWILIVLAYLTGFFVEYLGVNYGLIFGSYEYLSNLGPKIEGVPWIIGVNWIILLVSTAVISNRIFSALIPKVLSGAFLMVMLDVLIEQLAPGLGFWVFEGRIAPFQNYVGWFAVAFLLHFVYHKLKLRGDVKFAFHLYFSQIVFFGYLYVAGL